MRIYTRAGDAGETDMLGGARRLKDDPVFQVVGEIDELNALIGAARSKSPSWVLDSYLERYQNVLFELGMELASTDEVVDRNRADLAGIVDAMEHSIDLESEHLPPLKNFVLPGGSEQAAQLHIARVVCRRLERSVLSYRKRCEVRDDVLVFLNRLSDWLFIAARVANQEQGAGETIWKRG